MPRLIQGDRFSGRDIGTEVSCSWLLGKIVVEKYWILVNPSPNGSCGGPGTFSPVLASDANKCNQFCFMSVQLPPPRTINVIVFKKMFELKKKSGM